MIGAHALVPAVCCEWYWGQRVLVSLHMLASQLFECFQIASLVSSCGRGKW